MNRDSSRLRQTRGVACGILVIAATAIFAPVAMLHGQTVTCPVPPGAPGEVVRVTIGYFTEAEREIGDFCRLLVTARIAAVFVPLGKISDPETAQRIQAALEAGRVDVLWVNTTVLGQLISGSSIVAKVLGVTDFLVVHVVARDPRIDKVTDLAFQGVEVRVPSGRSGFFADALFMALGLPIRCLDQAFRCAEARSDGEYKVFLDEPRPRAVVLAVPTLHRSTRDAVALVLAQISSDYRLVAIPPEVVVRMRRLPGMVSTVAIPMGYYGLGSRRDVPPANIPSAAAAMLLVGSTPASVATRVQEFTGRINQVLLAGAPRLPGEVLVSSLQMVREMSGHAPGRIALHPEYAGRLQALGALLPGLPVAEAQPGPGPSTPPPPPSVSGVQIQQFAANPRVSAAGQRVQLCWVIVGARAAAIDPEVGELSPGRLRNGCHDVFPRRTTTYVLSATDPDGRTVLARTIVVVVEQPARLPAPRPISPGGPTSARSQLVLCKPVELVWAAVGGRAPITYAATLERLTATGGPAFVKNFTTQQTRVDVTSFVGEGGTYRWNVRARDAAGSASEPSQYLYFGCAPG